MAVDLASNGYCPEGHLMLMLLLKFASLLLGRDSVLAISHRSFFDSEFRAKRSFPFIPNKPQNAWIIPCVDANQVLTPLVDDLMTNPSDLTEFASQGKKPLQISLSQDCNATRASPG